MMKRTQKTKAKNKAKTGKPKKTRAVRAGRRAEFFAAQWLRLKAYRIVPRNYKRRMGEVDIIARRGGVLIFVEVKYRPHKHAAMAAVSPRQWQRIARAAQDFTTRHPAYRMHVWRFDMVVCAPYQWPRHIADCWRMR